MKYNLTIISISLIAAIIIGAVFLYPKYQDYSALSKQIKQKEKDLQSQQDYLQKLAEINRKVEEKKDLIAKVDSAIPDEPDIPSFLNFLDETAENTGVSLENIEWSEMTSRQGEKQATKQYLVNMQVSGSYFSLKNFLNTLELSARLVEVLNTDFSLAEETEEPDIFDIKLKLHSY